MLQVVLNRNVNTKYKVLELYLLSCGLLGIIFVAGVVVNLFYHFVSPSFSYFYLYPSLILLSTACFIGCNGNYWQRLLSALFCWVFVIVESISAWFSLIKPPKRFDIIKKVWYSHCGFFLSCLWFKKDWPSPFNKSPLCHMFHTNSHLRITWIIRR